MRIFTNHYICEECQGEWSTELLTRSADWCPSCDLCCEPYSASEREEPTKAEASDIVVRRDDIAPAQWRWQAYTRHGYENYEPETDVGTGATPEEAVQDLFWHLDLPEDTEHTVTVVGS